MKAGEGDQNSLFYKVYMNVFEIETYAGFLYNGFLV